MNRPVEILESILMRYNSSASVTEASYLLDTIVNEIEDYLGVTAQQLQEDND